MYKVFINDRPLYFVRSSRDFEFKKDFAYLRFDDIPYLLLPLELLDEEQFAGIFLIGDEWDMLEQFKEAFPHITAAGGVVENKIQQVLMIYRRGKWDLPKGKIDEGETSQEAAIREVEEETGIGQLKIKKELPATYHMYPLEDGDWAFKETFWFRMETTDTSKPVPETEEDIEKVQWFEKDELQMPLGNTYPNILELMNFYLVG